MNLLNRVSQHPHTCAVCESGILYSALKPHPALKAYLFLKLNAFPFSYTCSTAFSTGIISRRGLFSQQEQVGGKLSMWFYCVFNVLSHSFLDHCCMPAAPKVLMPGTEIAGLMRQSREHPHKLQQFSITGAMTETCKVITVGTPKAMRAHSLWKVIQDLTEEMANGSVATRV